MIAIGIDPGLTGAMALLCERRGFLDVVDLPVCPNGLETGAMKRWLDPWAVCDVLSHWTTRHELHQEDVSVFLERPIAMPGQQISTAASNFDCQGTLRTISTIRGYRLKMITPNEWKKTYGLTRDKDGSRQIAVSLYANAVPALKRVKDHNRAEAILIARYGMRRLAG